MSLGRRPDSHMLKIYHLLVPEFRSRGGRDSIREYDSPRSEAPACTLLQWPATTQETKNEEEIYV
jgi:hypothetical protein